MTHRVYCERLESPTVEVEDAEAHHLLHVLRIRTGAEVELFDGCGSVASGRVLEMTRRSVTIEITQQWVDETQPSGIAVAVSPPKGDRLKWMIEKLTELGVDRIILLQTQRTIVTPGETRVDKLKANVVAACKQCRRNRFLEIESLTSLSDVLAATTLNPTMKLFVAHPSHVDQSSGSGAARHRQSSASQLSPPGLLLVGPEGGFTDDEVDECVSSGAIRVSWPDTILRIETAALALASAMMASRISCE